MKQKHINNAVVYLTRVIWFIMLFVGFLVVLSSVSFSNSKIIYYFVGPLITFILVLSIMWSILMFFDEVNKGVSK